MCGEAVVLRPGGGRTAGWWASRGQLLSGWCLKEPRASMAGFPEAGESGVVAAGRVGGEERLPGGRQPEYGGWGWDGLP
ncbi:hypothetical protein GCM10009560_00800 [Nonomuraea longicatena]|uniref:Uncharacterized protein n=1 Tax=Nonomuraea longicatena TaxID=83682 RepID=A0ABN1NM64_9ACTN